MVFVILHQEHVHVMMDSPETHVLHALTRTISIIATFGLEKNTVNQPAIISNGWQVKIDTIYFFFKPFNLGEACQKMCGQLGYKLGTGTCYMDPAKYKCAASKFCNNHGTCNPANGVCTCQKGYGGNNCDTVTCKDSWSNCAQLAQSPGICSLSASNINIHIAKGDYLLILIF